MNLSGSYQKCCSLVPVSDRRGRVCHSFFFFCFFFLFIVGFGSGLFLVVMGFGVIGLGRGSIVGVLFVEEVGDLVGFFFGEPAVTVQGEPNSS